MAGADTHVVIRRADRQRTRRPSSGGGGGGDVNTRQRDYYLQNERWGSGFSCAWLFYIQST